MNREEALKAMIDGEIIDSGKLLYMYDDGKFFVRIRNKGARWGQTSSLNNETYSIYKELPKVKVAYFRQKDGLGTGMIRLTEIDSADHESLSSSKYYEQVELLWAYLK